MKEPVGDGYENIRDGNLGAYHTYEEVVDELDIIQEKLR